MSRINTNVSSLFAQKTLARTNDQLNTAMSRLSSGLRINTAADDPAGLIASEVLRSDMTAVSKAITNTDRADQLIQTADSALGQVSNLLNDIRGLVVEAANSGALSTEQIAANQLQVDSSLEAIDRIARTTAFGGKKLLDGSQAILTSAATSTIEDLDINQVNLGNGGAGVLNGTMSVAITVNDAAQKATKTDASTATNTNGTTAGGMTFGLGSASNTVRTFDLQAKAGASVDNLKILFTSDTNNVSASFDTSSNVLTIKLDSNSNMTEAQIEAAINGVNGGNTFENTDVSGDINITGIDVNNMFFTETSSTANATQISTRSDFGTGNATNSGTYSGTNLMNRVYSRVVQITGNKGSEVFTFADGTTQTQMATQINAVTDSTGVAADATSGSLVLTSETYGLDSFVDIEVISEGSLGNYKTNDSGSSIGRDYGQDIDATVNGIKAAGKGNTMQVRNGVLDADIRVTAGSSAAASFNITGGGASFQLGADVITPQRAQIGIESVNTGKVGGESGRLYELKTGQNAALATDAITAGKIVDEAILSVANTRGRLGAFSATTLASNKTALSDYLVNLTDAESSLRDADFAKESAALTRAQVLVQSGTSILAIANQNPQNMLALIR